MTTLREKIVETAKSYCPLSATNDLDRFTDLITPTIRDGRFEKEISAQRKALRAALKKPFGSGGLSTCGMVAEGIWAKCGVDFPALYKPYVFGTAVSRAITFAQKNKAWVPANGRMDEIPELPEPGDYVVIGCRSPGESIGGIEHAFIVVDYEIVVDMAKGCVIMDSVDGGQVDEHGLQAVKVCCREAKIHKGRLWLMKPGTLVGRRVLGWVDVDKLPVIQEEE